jgi:hypothetical protein
MMRRSTLAAAVRRRAISSRQGFAKVRIGEKNAALL